MRHDGDRKPAGAGDLLANVGMESIAYPKKETLRRPDPIAVPAIPVTEALSTMCFMLSGIRDPLGVKPHIGGFECNQYYKLPSLTQVPGVPATVLRHPLGDPTAEDALSTRSPWL